MSKNNEKKNDKPVNTKKAKPALFNTMFHKPSYYLLFTLLLIAIALISYVYLDEIKCAGSQITSLVKEVIVKNTPANYQKSVNKIVTEYFKERDQLSDDELNYQNENNLTVRENLIKQAIAELTDLKVTDEYKDFHLSLVLCFKQIESSEKDFINSIKFRFGLFGQAQNIEQADKLKQASLSVYQNTLKSIEGLAQQYQWFKYQ